MNAPAREPLRTLDDVVRFERAAPLGERLLARSVYEVFQSSAERLGDRPAVTMIMTGEEDERPRVVSYRELAAGVTRAANLFAELGGGLGQGVAFLLPSLVETQLTLWGAESAGYAVPLNFLLQADQIAQLVRASGARVLVALGPHPALDIWQKAIRVRELVPGLVLVGVAAPETLLEGAISFPEGLARQPSDRLAFGAARGGEDVAAYFHTGGTTGAPKLVTHTHRSQLASAYMGAHLMALTEADVLTNGLPMFHVGGTIVCGLSAYVSGAHAVLLSPGGFRNPVMIRRYWRIVERTRTTIMGGVPTSLGALCEVPVDGDLSTVRMVLTGAASTPRAVAERLEAHTGKRLHEIFGMTETSGLIALDPALGERTIGSVGVRLPYSEIRVRRLESSGELGEDCDAGEVGVLTVRGPQVSPGYRDASQNTAWKADGWLDTGDLGYLDEGGKLHVAGRSKDLIIRGGHNLDPAMIEEAFAAHPKVALAAAVGAPDEYAGEVPVCYVALRPGEVASVEELSAFAEARIAEPPARPRQVHILESIPLTAIGKIYKPALRADAARRVAEARVREALGHAPLAVEAAPGGPRGMVVTVTVAESDVGRKGAIEAALGSFLFEARVASAAAGAVAGER